MPTNQPGSRPVDRDKCRSDYEEKLRAELEQIRVRTDAEIERLKTSTREMYERENRLDAVSLLLVATMSVHELFVTGGWWWHVEMSSSFYVHNSPVRAPGL